MKETRKFYEEILNFPIALEQSGCVIFQIGNFGYWGFCETDKNIEQPEQICLTVVVNTREEVDVWHKHMQEKNVKMNREPQYTAQYKIYNGFYSDPSGYTIEIQAFDKEGQPIGHDDFSK